jgi:hypothetical protein
MIKLKRELISNVNSRSVLSEKSCIRRAEGKVLVFAYACGRLASTPHQINFEPQALHRCL